MKTNNLFLLLLMALLFVSCSEDETTMSIPQEGNAIEFATYVGRDAQTRASVTNLEALKADGVGFGVFAYYTKGTDYATDPATKPNFMYNQQVKWSATATDAWKYEPVKYWPNETTDKLTFFAYAPYSRGNDYNISDFAPTKDAAGNPTLKFTVNDTVKQQTDLVWGVNTTDDLPFLNQTKQTVTGNINFTFKHALARIGFNVEAMVDLVNTDGTTGNGTIGNNTKIVITKVELIGKFYPWGTLNLNNTVANTPSWTTGNAADRTFTLEAKTDADLSNFATAALVAPVTDKGTFGQIVTTTAATLNKDDSYIMVIPQKFDGNSEDNKIKIRVTYDVITKDTNLETGQSKITNVITSDPFAFTFDAGKAYLFNLHLGLTSVKFDATMTDWADETGTVVNVPINTTTTP